jgi:hypothetical protein
MELHGEMELHGFPSHPRYHPAAISVDNTWSCK